jgi:hypothetical protein
MGPGEHTVLSGRMGGNLEDMLGEKGRHVRRTRRGTTIKVQ